jgi:hypothetical protein
MLRLLPGQPADVAGESISSYSLIKAAVNNPDVLPTVWRLFPEEAPLSQLLAAKGLFTKNLRDNMSETQNKYGYRVVKSNHVMYPVANTDQRKCTLVDNGSGVAFKSDAYSTKPGLNQTPFYIYLDSNWARPKEVIQLADLTTLIYVYDENEPVETTSGWRYECKMVTKNNDSYVDTALLQIGSECAPQMTMYEHDFSETGHEKYTFDGWGHAYMTLQRVKMSYSGTAAAMGNSKEWYAFRNSKGDEVTGYIDYAEKEMMKRIIRYQEFAKIFGRGTVTEEGVTILKDKRGREILAGDGILHQGDGAYEYPMNGPWTFKRLEHVMRDLDIRTGKDGLLEVVMGAGYESRASFGRMMREAGLVTQNNNIVGDGAAKGVIQDYSFYELDGVRIIPKRIRFFDSQATPSIYLSDGTKRSSWDAVFVPLGQDEKGQNGIELIQLRPMKTGSVHGINVGGDGMASSVDGSSKHVLIQDGVISRVKIARSFRNS